MNKPSPKIFLIISLFILISLACNGPVISQFLSNLEGSSSTDRESDGAAESDTGVPHNTDGAEITFIAGATFLMGSPETENLADEAENPADDDEFPQHQVTVDEFHIYTYEVTNQMYSSCVDAGFCLEPYILDDGPTSHYKDPEFKEHPVVGVDWVNARDYCTWAGSRLPTEAEWELVSRGPDSLYYPWGDDEPTCDYVNMKGCFVPGDTQLVGYYLLGNSPDEVWDMSGNVWEWVHDWYADDYYEQSPEDNPIGPIEPQDPDKPLRVVRGGGLNSDPDKMRSASRIGLNPYRTWIDVGFRCVVGEGLSFPPGYDHGEDRHDRVPPDTADGDDPDDDSGLRSIRLFAGCRTSEIVDLGVVFDPADPALVGASTDFGPLACDHDPPPDGAYYCYDLPGSSGDTINLYFSFADGSSVDTSVEYPDCSLPLRIEHFCDPDETGAIIPYLVLFYPPGGPGFVGAAAAHPPDAPIDLDCVITALGTAVCHGLPGAPGDMLGIFAAFDDGSTLHGEYPHPVCLDAEGLIPAWDLLLSCIPHADGTAEYRAAIDTNMAGWDFIPGSWTFTVVPEPKNCILENPALNIWGCTFPIGAYTEFEFCAEWVGGSGLHCVTFGGIAGILPGDCSRPPDDDDDGDPVMGWCIPSPGGCGPCMPTCPPPNNCNPCTMP